MALHTQNIYHLALSPESVRLRALSQSYMSHRVVEGFSFTWICLKFYFPCPFCNGTPPLREYIIQYFIFGGFSKHQRGNSKVRFTPQTPSFQKVAVTLIEGVGKFYVCYTAEDGNMIAVDERFCTCVEIKLIFKWLLWCKCLHQRYMDRDKLTIHCNVRKLKAFGRKSIFFTQLR